MRLLQLTSDQGLRLTQNMIHNIPPYAILSHTWGPDSDEVNFQDLTEHPEVNKVGYRKLKFCGNQAAKDGLHYFWVDTCCIDKSSSAEIAENINSMFRYYQEAAKCYVYLSDVSIGDGDGACGLPSTFEKSRWFTRGWTLQELVAPASVEFFSNEGHLLGDKKSIERQIHDITGIATEALQGQLLSHFSVDERKSWAAKRSTTRKEDKAYCLLGIFGVYLLPIYGEGDNAFTRLEEEIKKRSEALDITQTIAVTPSSTIPFRRDHDFVDRGEILGHLLKRCSFPAARTALVGLGGVGKSQLVIELAYQVQSKSPSTWVFWVHGSSAARFEEGYRNIADAARLPGRNQPKVDILKLVHNWLCHEVKEDWVMIVDNADDCGVFFRPRNKKGAAENDSGSGTRERPLCAFLPTTSGAIVFTSRDKDLAFRFTGRNQDIIQVGPMSESDALILLEKKLQNSFKTDSHERNKAPELLKALDYIPLAITQACAYLSRRSSRTSITEYLQQLHSENWSQANPLSHDMSDPQRYETASNAIIATWQISFEHIRRIRPSAAELLSLMSFFDRQGIPEELLVRKKEEGGSIHGTANDTSADNATLENIISDNFEEDISVLRAYSFISTEVKGTSFEMHRLVQLSTRRWLEQEGQLERWKEEHTAKMDKAFPVPYYKDWPKCQQLFPHAEMVAVQRPVSPDSLIKWACIVSNAANYALMQGKYTLAETLARKALVAREETHGEDEVDLWYSRLDLALIWGRQGKIEKAEEMSRQVLDGLEKVIGSHHFSTLVAAGHLARMLQILGKGTEAVELYRRAYEGYKEELGEEARDTLISMDGLARGLQRQGQYDEAEELSRRVLRGVENVLGNQTLEASESLCTLAGILDSQGNYEEAEEKMQLGLEGYEKLLGKEHPTTLSALGVLSSILRNQGQSRYKEAEEIGRQALEGHIKVMGRDNTFTIWNINNMALVLTAQGPPRWEEAEEKCREAVDEYEQLLGKEHYHTLASVYNLAYMLGLREKYEEAREYLERAYMGYTDTLGADHPTTLACHNQFSVMQKWQDNPKAFSPLRNPWKSGISQDLVRQKKGLYRLSQKLRGMRVRSSNDR